MAAAKGKKKQASKQQNAQGKRGTKLDKMTTDVKPIAEKSFKVKLPIRIGIIVLSVLALSCFFEGWRQVQNSITVSHVAILFGGTLVTAALLWLQGFWIYLEEKSKGTLRKRITHFDRLQEYFEKKRGQ